MIIAIIMITSFPYVDSYAYGDTPLDDDNHYYLGNNLNFIMWDNDDILTQDNYNSFYDELSGELKTGVVNYFANTNGDFSQDRFVNTLLNDYSVGDGYINLDNLYFKPIVVNGEIIPIENCKKVLGYIVGSNLFHCILLYSPFDTEIAFGTGYRRGFFSSDNFYMSYVSYPMSVVNIDNIKFIQFKSENNSGQLYSSEQSNQGFPIGSRAVRMDNLGSVLYSDVTCLFQALTNNTLVGSNSIYKYDEMANYGAAWLNNSDDTGFIVDRRTSLFLDNINQTPDDPIDHSLGVLEGSFNNLIVGNSVNYQYLFTNFVLNNYTKNMKNNINLKLNYRVTFEGYANGEYFNVDNNFYDTNGFYDSYNIYNSNYIQIDLDEVLKNIRGETDNSGLLSVINTLPAFNGVNFQPPTLSMFDTLNLYINNDLINESIVHQEINTTIWQDIVNSADSVAQKIFGQTPTFIDKNANVQILNCTLYITQFLEDKSTNKTSESNIFIYDYLSGNVQEVGGFENNSETDIPFNGFYMDKNWSLNDNGIISTSGNNGGIVGGSSSSNASVGDIYVNVGTQGVGQVIVDMPADEWLQHSPNFNELISIVKSGLTDVSEGSQSVTALLAASYSVFPPAIWGYLALAIAIISALSVIRYIRRG